MNARPKGTTPHGFDDNAGPQFSDGGEDECIGLSHQLADLRLGFPSNHLDTAPQPLLLDDPLDLRPLRSVAHYDESVSTENLARGECAHSDDWALVRYKSAGIEELKSFARSCLLALHEE